MEQPATPDRTEVPTDVPTAGDPVLDAVSAVLTGRPGAAEGLLALWSPEAGAWDRCVIAHYLADTQPDAARALEWDRRALAAAQEIEPGEVGRFGFDREQMLPSLHLNLAANLAEVGDDEAARQHLRLARDQLHRLPDAGYATTIAGGLDRLAARLGVTD